MSRPSATQLARIRRLLAAEATGAGAEAYAAAAGAVYQKLDAQLSLLLGRTGFQMLLARATKLAQPELTCTIEVAVVESSTSLRAFLQALDPAAAAEAAEVLFGTFFTLLTTFIGDRLTVQALRRAWPAIEEPAAPETKK